MSTRRMKRGLPKRSGIMAYPPIRSELMGRTSISSGLFRKDWAGSPKEEESGKENGERSCHRERWSRKPATFCGAASRQAPNTITEPEGLSENYGCVRTFPTWNGSCRSRTDLLHHFWYPICCLAVPSASSTFRFPAYLNLVTRRQPAKPFLPK